jgi:DNA-binding winged helix-turn-helix (wHTH) protein
MSTIFLFGDCRLDPSSRELVRAEKVQQVEPQVLDLIIDLVEHRGRLVTRDELLERIWQGRIVSESTLSSRIKMARRALGDSGRAQALIRTIHGRGFRFVGVVSIEDDAAGAERTSPSGHALEVATPPSGAAAVGRHHGTEAERRQLTIVRCSLADAALALDGVDAEEVDEFLARARAILTATFEAQGGHIAGIYPAGLLVYFGWPRALEDAASLAVRAALAVGPALAGLSGAG